MDEHVAFLNEQVDRHHAWFSKSLPMIASENVISPMAREMLVSDFGDRYAEGLPHERYYQGNAFVDEVEDRVVALAKQIFRVRHMDPRLISGTVANMAVYFALLEPGDIMTSVALSHGAHISSAKFGAAGLRGVNNVNYPFDVDRMNIDVDEPAKLIRLERAVFPGVVSNHHLHAMAALGVTLAEFLAFGRDYAAQIVRNAKALAQALHERGIKVLAEKHGFTESHALALDVAAFGGGAKVATDLEKARIITNKNLLPWDTSPVRPSGIRLGTQELTRLGMKEAQMREVADLFARILVKGEAVEAIATEVAAMRTEFNTVHYCFTKDAEAHRRWRLA